ncbi:MAG: TrkH family potassium uptake protein, partial [Caldisericales bacterium]
MIRKLTLMDFKSIMYYTGMVMLGVAITMFIPLIIALIYGEFDSAIDFGIGIVASALFGLVCTKYLKSGKSSNLFQSMVVAAFSWLVACAFCAIPYYLSGHYGSFLDAYFDLMSGFTTTGLVLIKDVDHASNALNM